MRIFKSRNVHVYFNWRKLVLWEYRYIKFFHGTEYDILVGPFVFSWFRREER